uniref:Uncharacterized protein n=1 Tax=Plectus sambesii TaxID=2011161 RepID=A0A914UXS5_9BILA
MGYNLGLSSAVMTAHAKSSCKRIQIGRRGKDRRRASTHQQTHLAAKLYIMHECVFSIWVEILARVRVSSSTPDGRLDDSNDFGPTATGDAVFFVWRGEWHSRRRNHCATTQRSVARSLTRTRNLR